MELQWKDGFVIRIRIDGDTVVVSANKEGLLSLSGHLTALAEEPAGSHIHLDEYNALEEHSGELLIEKIGQP